MEFDDTGTCNTSLGLGMIIHRPTVLAQADDDHQQSNTHKELFLKYDHLLPSLSLGRSENKLKSAAKMNQLASSVSALMSPSIYNSRGSSDHEDENGSHRKKLRLTKQQFATLEETFEEHNTLNPKQKQALAEKLNLRPRQVEVWFQNRRARNKLKQSEADCELLKRCCETLKEENKRLQREVQELKSMKLYMQLPVATLTSLCPSCERLGSASASAGDGDGDDDDDSSFTFVSKPLYNSLTYPSAASC